MRGRNLMKVIGITIIATTLVLTGCGNEETKKTDTEKQTKTVKEQDKKVKIESNEGKPQHEQVITVKMPPEADYINDETLEVYEQDLKKYNNTSQLITDNSITVLLGNFCFYDPIWDVLKCSAILVNGTDTKIEALSFQSSVENKAMPEKTFSDDNISELTKVKTGDFLPNVGIPIILVFSDETSTTADDAAEPQKIDTKNITIKLKNIQYKMVE
ncbi:hypothetical protein HCA37_04420 [Listeria seeligeri]|uniref:hypothetical protein n=1 Tax=Listeria seeligeri TaxID=1640 RepID=UPI001627ED9E|nr:hypothetical protein [Listeria seeligeri]MBC1479456.1 hypothetical protein [Listeria seeligeri]MBC1789558.1 hypothetical protein [Listeria seeligeri]MBC1846139.1 hypothetical protein [Listeria seeligeri]